MLPPALTELWNLNKILFVVTLIILLISSTSHQAHTDIDPAKPISWRDLLAQSVTTPCGPRRSSVQVAHFFPPTSNPPRSSPSPNDCLLFLLCSFYADRALSLSQERSCAHANLHVRRLFWFFGLLRSSDEDRQCCQRSVTYRKKRRTSLSPAVAVSWIRVLEI